MSMMNKRTTEEQHPWLTEFENAPEEAFGDLLAGYASIHPYERADAPDAARMLFGPLDPEDGARAALGPTIISWLEMRRKEQLPAARGRRQRRVREISEAFEIVTLLGLTDAAVELRRRSVTWNDWIARLVLSSARDARAEFWRTLALTQRLVAEAAPELDPHGLAPLWQRICRESGGRLPKRYLDIGLLGLRRLPETEGGSELPWIWGLAQWALAQNPSDSEFMAEWLALKALHPRAPQRWRKLVSGLLSAPLFTQAGIEPPAWWGTDPDVTPMLMKRKDFKSSDATVRSPMPEECNRVIEKFNSPFDVVKPQIDMLLQGHRRYLNATGDPHYFVRAIHALGVALIAQEGDNPDARAQKAEFLAREGLEWAPNDWYLWSLWRNALAAKGAFEAAEMVGWEFIRRDPLRPLACSQLAGLLAQSPVRRDDAEALLNETIEKFPDNAHVRNQLAELLIAEDRTSKAADVVDAAFDAQVNNAATYALRARICSHEGRTEEATAAVLSGLDFDPSNEVLSELKRRLAAGEPLPFKSHALEEDTRQSPAQAETGPVSDPVLEDVMRRGTVRRLRFWMGSAVQATHEDALRELRRILHEDPTFAYAELLAARHRIWEAESDVLPAFASSFEYALATEDREKLEELAQRQPRLEALILVARAVLGDAEAAQMVEAWLRDQQASNEEPAGAALRAGLRPIFKLIEGGRSAKDTFVEKRETVIRALYDANEVTLGDLLLAA